ncbi:putative secreted protein, partial [Rhodopirellula maiorica SM1]
MKYIVAVYCCLLVAATNVHAESATLQMRFVFDGVPPPVNQINVLPALAPAGGPVLDERLLVDPVSKGIRNVVVYVYTGRGGSKLGPFPRSDKKHRLAMSN